MGELDKEAGIDLGLGLFLNPPDASPPNEAAYKSNNGEQANIDEAAKVIESEPVVVELSEFESGSRLPVGTECRRGQPRRCLRQQQR